MQSRDYYEGQIIRFAILQLAKSRYWQGNNSVIHLVRRYGKCPSFISSGVQMSQSSKTPFVMLFVGHLMKGHSVTCIPPRCGQAIQQSGHCWCRCPLLLLLLSKELIFLNELFKWHILLSFSLSLHVWILLSLEVIHKLRHTNFMIFCLSPVLVTGGHISEIHLPSVTSYILQFYI